MREDNLSLYFQLRPGERADLEVVSEAALHWVRATKLAALALDPNVQVRVGIVDAEEGSLRLNVAFDWLESQVSRIAIGSDRYPTLRAIAIGLAIFVATAVATPAIEELFYGEPTVSLSDEDRQLIRELLERVRDEPEVKSEGRKFFRALERDPSISGTGLASSHDSDPNFIVPSKDFAIRSGLFEIVEEDYSRTINPVVDVILISPVLVSRPRSWAFKPEGLPEFKATMKDRQFLAALEKDDVRERLRTGIKMTLRLAVKQVKSGDEWMDAPRGRAVIEVISPKTY